MQAHVPLSALLYLLLGLAAFSLPLSLIGWAERGLNDELVSSSTVMLALLCVAVICLAFSLIRCFTLLCQIRVANERIESQNADLERQSVELEARNEELCAQQVELEHTANNLIGTNILLLQSSRRFQELFQGVPIACYCYDRGGRIIEWNRACEALYGFPSDEIFEKRIWETICAGEEAERVEEIVDRVFGGESFAAVEWTNLRADGSRCQVLCNTFPLRGHDGAILGAISANIDITERAAALDLLAENEERYRKLVEHTPDAIAVHCEGAIAYMNPAGLALLGAERADDVLGKPFLDFIHPACTQSVRHWIKRSEASKAAEPAQQRIVRLDGSVTEIEATAIPISYKGGLALQLVIRDISARRQAEALLQQQSAAMQASMDGCGILNQKGEYVFLNQAHAAVYGYENIGDLMGKSWKTLYDKEELARFENEIMPALFHDGQWRGEAIGRKHGGGAFRQEVSLTLIEGGGLACVVRDITERKLAEEKLRYIMAGARCILWEATVVDNGGERLEWETRMPDEEASERFLPLKTSPGQSYSDALYFGRIDEDRERCDNTSENAVRSNQSYSQEFRCRRADGEIRWLAEDVSVEPLGPGRWRVIGVCMDVTDTKRAEEITRSVTEAAICLLWEAEIVDEGGERTIWYMSVNDEAAAQRFLTLEMEPGQSYVDAWYKSRIDEDRIRCDATSEAALQSNQSYSQEFRCRRADGEIRWLAEDVAVEAMGPNRWRAVGVCMDVTERKRAEEMSRSIANAARCLLWEAEIHEDSEYGLRWDFHLSDDAAQRFLPLDIEPGESYTDAWYRSRLEDDQARCNKNGYEKILANQSYSQEFRCRRLDGEIRWLAEDVNVEPLGPGRWRAVGVCLDVTDRKRAEEMSRSIIDAGRCLLWEATVEYDGQLMHWDIRLTDEEAAHRFLPIEMRPGQRYHQAWNDARLPEDRERTNQYGTAKILANQSYSQEFRCRRRDGEIRWLAEDVTVEPIGANRWRAVGLCMDVTERKRAEEMSRSIVEAGRCLLWEAEVRLVEGKLRWEWRLTDEEAAHRFLPLEVEPGRSYHDAWYFARPEEDRAKMSRYGREKILANQSYSQEFRTRRADGEIRWLAEDVAIELVGPDRWRAVGVCLDITERKRAEEVTRSITDAARCLLWEAEVEEHAQGALDWRIQISDTEAAQRFLPLAVPEGASYGQTWNMSRHPDDRKRIDDHAAEMIRAGQSYSQEFRCIAADGSIRWLAEEVAVEEVAQGRWRAVGVCLDISERKRAEEISHSIVDAARCLLWEAQVELIDGRLLWDLRLTDEKAAQRFLPIEIAPGETYKDAWHRSRSEEDSPRLDQYALEMITADKNYSQEFRCRRADGEVRWLAEEVVVELVGPNKWRTVGVCVDITDRKRAEEHLRYIMASAHCLFWDAIVTDQGGALTWEVRISDEDAAQRLLPLYVPRGRQYVDAWINSRLEEDHIRMADLAGKEIRANRGYSQEFRCRRRDGEIRWLAEDVTVAPLGPGRWQAVGVCIDVTERKRAESVLRDDVQRFSSIIATQYDIVKAKLDLNKLMRLTVERVQKLTGAASASIGLIEGNEIVWRARRARRSQKGSETLDSVIARRCIESGEIVHCPDLKAAALMDKDLATDLAVRSVIGIPLHHIQKVTGVLIAHSQETYAFGERNVQTLQLMAGLISTALEHAAEFEEKQALLAERTAALTALQDSEARFKAFMDNTPAIAFMKDSEGRRVWANRTYQERFQQGLADLIGKTDFDLYPQEIAQHIKRTDLEVLRGNKPLESRELIPVPVEGMRNWWSFRFPFQDRTGQRFLGGVAFDVTEQKIAEDALRESEERFRLAINSIHEGLVLMDSEGRIQLFNQSAERILGQIAEQILIDQPIEPGWRMVGEDGKDFDEENRPIEVTLRTGQSQRDVVVGVEKPNSDIVWISFNTVPLFRPGESKPYAAVASFTDITERRRVAQQITEQMQIIQNAHATLETQQAQLVEANTKLKALATLDGLTGLKNHRAFQEKLEAEYQRAVQAKKPISLLLLDVDMFKLYNDTFGHLAGDEVLKSAARILRENARGSDFVARYGGEEFVVIVPRADHDKALAVAERFRAAFESAPWKERPVTASFGIATLNAQITAPSQLIADADRALYHAKANGRNRVSHIDDVGPGAQQSVLFRHWRGPAEESSTGDAGDTTPPAQAA